MASLDRREAVVDLHSEAGRERGALNEVHSAVLLRTFALLVPRLSTAKAEPHVAFELRLLALEAAVPLLQAIGAPNIRSISRRASGSWRSSRSLRCSWRGARSWRSSASADNSRLPQRLLHKGVELRVVDVLPQALQEHVDLLVADVAGLVVDVLLLGASLDLLGHRVVHGVE